MDSRWRQFVDDPAKMFIELGRKTRDFSREIQGPTWKPKGFLFI